MRLPTSAAAGAAATALAATLLLAACTADGDSDAGDATPEATPTAEQSAEPEETGPADVPDVTNLILETAQGNLLRAGLEVEVVDEAGETLTVDDATTLIVTAQDPTDGTLDRGSVVTLTVKPRG